MDVQANCPKCGSSDTAVSVEELKPRHSAAVGVVCVLAVVVFLWRGASAMAAPYTTQAAHNTAIALMFVGVCAAIVLPIVYFKTARKRPCRVQRCPRCGHAVALDAPPRGFKSWKLD